MNQPLHDLSLISSMEVAAHDPQFFSQLSQLERLVLANMWSERLRTNQKFPNYRWKYCGWICGRGYGKSLAIAAEINRRVMNGEARQLALMAHSTERSEEVQIKFLVDTSPPWFRAAMHKGGVLWPNGATANVFTPEAPGRSRGENLELSWLCELVDWVHTGRDEAFDNITTATRIGASQVFWDTTSKGRNSLILRLLRMNESDPVRYPIIRGTTFDNPMFDPDYLRSEYEKYSGARRDEELFGKTFAESQGALWLQKWIDNNRVSDPPLRPRLRLVSIDPALSDASFADETGIVVGSVADRVAYAEKDLTGRYRPESWGDIVVNECISGNASGVVIERNHLGDNATYVLRSRAKEHNMQVRVLEKKQRFPQHTRGIIYVREVVSNRTKETRAAAPATETEAGNVKFVGEFSQLEDELTSYEPGIGRSPNRYDAFSQMINELLELGDDRNREGDMKAAKDAQTTMQKSTVTRSASVQSPLTVRGRRRLGI
jgi:phage terminase large subunit-like protein